MLIETSVGTLNVSVAGHGEPVLLWPSLFLDGEMWRGQAAALQPDHQVIVVDGPGHGASGPGPIMFSQADCAAAAFQILDRLRVAAPVTVVGCSWGGIVGVEMALARPQRIHALVLANTPLHAYRGLERLKYRAILTMHRWVGVRIAAGTWSTFFAKPFLEDAKRLAEVTRGFMAADQKAMNVALSNTLLRRRDLTPYLSGLKAPTLVISGSADRVLKADIAETQSKAIPGARFVLIEGAGHVTPVEAPEVFNRAMLDFLARHPAPRHTATTG